MSANPLPQKKSSARLRAHIDGKATYRGRKCKHCGCNERRISDQQCVECLKKGPTPYMRNRDQALEYQRKYRQARYYANSEARALKMWTNAKYRALRKDLDFDISPEDIVIPDVCPVFGTPLTNPSLDRIDPRKGYVKGNIVVMSHRANTIKSDATAEELEKVLDFVKKTAAND